MIISGSDSFKFVLMSAVMTGGLLVSNRTVAKWFNDIAFTLDAPASCSDRGLFLDELHSFLGESYDDGPSDYRFEVTIKKQSDLWKVILKVHNKSDLYKRTIIVSSCREATKGAALLIALTLDPNAILNADESTLNSFENFENSNMPTNAYQPDSIEYLKSADAVKPGITLLPRVEIAPYGKLRKISAADLKLGIDSAFIIDFGSLYTPSIGAYIAFCMVINNFFIHTGIKFLPPTVRSIKNNSTGSVEMFLFASGLDIGYLFSLKRFKIAPGAVLWVSHINAATYDLTDNGQGSANWMSAGFFINGRWELLDHFAFYIGVRTEIPFSRPIFYADGIGQIHQIGRLIATVTIGVSLSFDVLGNDRISEF
jgi:hypothetical protein